MSDARTGNGKLSTWLPTLVLLFIYLVSFASLWGAMNARVDATEEYIKNSSDNMKEVLTSVNEVKTQLAIISNTGTIKAIENSSEIKELQKLYQELRNRLLILELKK